MKKLMVITTTILVFSTLSFTAYAMGGGMGGGMSRGMGGSGWGMSWLGGIFMFIFWIFIIIGIIFLVRWLIQTTREESGKNIDDSQNALDILKERYARGEINKQEFEGKKKDLL